MIYLKDYDNRRRIWHAGRPDLRLGEAEGLALILAEHTGTRTDRDQDLHVVEVLPGSDDDEVLVRYGDLGERRGPREVELPKSRRLDDFATKTWGEGVTRALVTPGVRWAKGHPVQRIALLATLFATALLAAFLLGDFLTPVAWFLPQAAAVYAAFSLLRPGAPTAIHREGNKKPYKDGEVRMRVAELPVPEPDDTLAIGAVPAPADRRTALERVEATKAEYGALLTDLAYRIENSALFDPAVGQTREFALLLARWDDEHRRLPADELGTLSREVQVAFDAARAHAEVLAIAHLPESAREDASRAAKAARLAQESTVDGERTAALERANEILATLALYYLPTPGEARKALGGPARELE